MIVDPLAEETHPLIGSVLRGTYRVQRVLDRGGMGIVFEAEQVRLARKVAIKILPGHLAREAHALMRFQREAELVSLLQHPHVVQIVDFDTTEQGEPYIVMELLSGESLATRLAREVKMPLAFAVRIATQAASGLAAVHGSLIVHRDLKPANVFLTQLPTDEVHVKLLDFGIGKRLNGSRQLTGENDVIGTPDYMPPEQALGKIAHIDQRSDQYSLAVIVYEILAGRTPFVGDMSAILAQVVNDEPPPLEQFVPNLPPRVGQVLRRAMAKEPSERFESIVAFSNALSLSALSAPLLAPEASSNTTLRLTSDPGVLSGTSPSSARGESGASGLREKVLPPSTAEAEPEAKSPAPPRVSAVAPAPTLPELLSTLERAKKARSSRNLDLASDIVEQALALADAIASPAAAAALEVEEALIEGVLEGRLGPRGQPLLPVAASPGASAPLLPEEAFLLSRIDGLASAEELLDLSPLSRLRTLRLLVRMLRRGLIRTAAS